jgi:type II secretory pathway component PulF
MLHLSLQALIFATLGILVIVPLTVACYALYFLVSLPLRRQERARVLVDLLELQEAQQQDPATAIKELSKTQDPALGVRFHILASYLESGMTLSDALKRVPRLLPEAITGVLQVGETLGDYRKVLPVCQTMLKDAASSIRNVTSNLILLLFIALPSLLILAVLSFSIWPKFQQIYQDYQTPSLPLIVATMEFLPKILLLLSIIYAALYLGAFLYVGGPRLRRWLEVGISPFTHALLLKVPWYRKRLLRDFSLMLGILLDADVPESEALLLAGQITPNQAFKRQVRRCSLSLESGNSLETAIQTLDKTPELAWRLRIASQQQAGFRYALKGWWQWLHAKAMQQEQSAVESFSIGMVLINGLLTAVLSIGVFHLISSVIEQGSLW